MLHSVEVDLGGGRTITLETGKMAKQANGAVVIRSGDSVVLVTACTAEQPKSSKVNIVVAGTEGGIVMVESGAQQASEAEVLAAIEFGHDCCKKIAAGIHELMKKAGKTKRAFTPAPVNQALYDQISTAV